MRNKIEANSWMAYPGAQIVRRGRGRARPHFVCCSQREERLHKWKDILVLTQRWRMVNAVADAPKLELYDIAIDPGHTVGIASQHSEVAKTLSTQTTGGGSVYLGGGRSLRADRSGFRTGEPIDAYRHGLAWRCSKCLESAKFVVLP